MKKIITAFLKKRQSRGCTLLILAHTFAYYLCGGYFMWAVYNAFLVYLLFHGKNRQILYLSLMGMTVSVLLNSVMVPQHGAFGAALTCIITYSLMALLCVICSWKYFR